VYARLGTSPAVSIAWKTSADGVATQLPAQRQVGPPSSITAGRQASQPLPSCRPYNGWVRSFTST
jgi:hypothetical protein